jgi:hypothetical protein
MNLAALGKHVRCRSASHTKNLLSVQSSFQLNCQHVKLLYTSIADEE